MLPAVAAVVLTAWAVYSPAIALGLLFLCGAISVFYAGALKGRADEKVLRLFSILVLILSIAMAGAFNSPLEDSGPRMCSGVAC